VAEPNPPTGAPRGERLFTPAFILLALAELAYFTAEGLTIPVTPLFAAGPLGADPFGVGIAVGVFAVSALILRPLAGRTADRRGRRPLLVGGALAYALIIAAHAATNDLAMLMVLRFLLGAAEAFFFVAGFAALADLAPPGRMGEALSFNSLALYMGIAIGPFLGEVLLEAGGFTAAWLGGAALALAAAVMAYRLPETSTRTSDTPDAPLIVRAAIGPGLALFCGITAMAGFLAFVALHARDVGMDGARLVLLTYGLIVVATRIVFARLPDRVSPMRLGAIALLLCASGMAVAGTQPTAIGLMAGTAILAVGVAFVTPAFFSAIFNRVSPSDRGAASGTASLFLDVAFGGGPMVFGFIAASGGIPAAFLAGGLLAAAGAVGTALAAVRAAQARVPRPA
jgi:predicted MFS family arabinose efflux permease